VSAVDVESRLFGRLEDVMQLCERLVDAGTPYGAVLICHELYRFLYPHEPVLGMTHDQPVPFMERHLAKMHTLGTALLEGVAPYPSTRETKPMPTTEALPRETSSLYSSLWKQFSRETLESEAVALLSNRVPAAVIDSAIKGKRVLDMGCGSGRYSLALAALGAEVTAVDYQAKAYAAASEIAREKGLKVTFVEGNVLELPFESGAFEFVFCNGVIHHTSNILGGLDELIRVMAPGASSFLYIYGAGGLFWTMRARARKFFERIPIERTQEMFGVMGVPGNRFVFCDTWYVPVERHTTKVEIEGWLTERKVAFEKLVSRNLIDLDNAIARDVPGARIMWGDGDHRYLLHKPA
jgi:SAM-dependent methyltransferase